jgi:hypothetical protein
MKVGERLSTLAEAMRAVGHRQAQHNSVGAGVAGLGWFPGLLGQGRWTAPDLFALG